MGRIEATSRPPDRQSASRLLPVEIRLDGREELQAQVYVRTFLAEADRLDTSAVRTLLDGRLPLAISPHALPYFARRVRWSLRHDDGTSASIRKKLTALASEIGSWNEARRWALDVGTRLAWAAEDRPRKVRFGRSRWIRDEEGNQKPVTLRELPSARLFWRRFQREAIKAAECWLEDRPYRPEGSEDALGQALPLSPNLSALETPVDPLETAEAAVDAWSALLVGAAHRHREVLEAATDRQREILEIVLGHLDNLDAEGAFGGNRYRQVAEAKKHTAEQLDITVGAIDQHFLRFRETV